MSGGGGGLRRGIDSTPLWIRPSSGGFNMSLFYVNGEDVNYCFSCTDFNTVNVNVLSS